MDREHIQDAKTEALRSAWSAAKENADYLPHLQSLAKYQLLQVAENSHLGVHNVRIVANGPGGKACPHCHAIANRVLSLSSELNAPSLPNAECTCTAYGEEQKGFCLCYYEEVFDDEL
jgi:hypothetical protein